MVDIKRRTFFRGSQQVLQQSLPWVKNSMTFTSDCTRCQQCIPVCETKIIQLGDGGFPSIDFHKGECTYCYACADACPEDIFALQNEEPWQQHIEIRANCLALNKVECRSCADSCEPQAIRFQLKLSAVAEPIVSTDSCNGCGGCIAHCPVDAITMNSSS